MAALFPRFQLLILCPRTRNHWTLRCLDPSWPLSQRGAHIAAVGRKLKPSRVRHSRCWHWTPDIIHSTSLEVPCGKFSQADWFMVEVSACGLDCPTLTMSSLGTRYIMVPVWPQPRHQATVRKDLAGESRPHLDSSPDSSRKEWR